MSQITRQITLLARERGALGNFTEYTCDMIMDSEAVLTQEDIFNTFGHAYEIHNYKISDEPHSYITQGLRNLVHFQLPNNSNVACYNGSAHAIRTTTRGEVTCPRCQERI